MTEQLPPNERINPEALDSKASKQSQPSCCAINVSAAGTAMASLGQCPNRLDPPGKSNNFIGNSKVAATCRKFGSPAEPITDGPLALRHAAQISISGATINKLMIRMHLRESSCR